MNIVDSVSIINMKQTDFIQLREMFEYVMKDGIRWGRKDWWDDRNKRISDWLDKINEELINQNIKQIEGK